MLARKRMAMTEFSAVGALSGRVHLSASGEGWAELCQCNAQLVSTKGRHLGLAEVSVQALQSFE